MHRFCYIFPIFRLNKFFKLVDFLCWFITIGSGPLFFVQLKKLVSNMDYFRDIPSCFVILELKSLQGTLVLVT